MTTKYGVSKYNSIKGVTCYMNSILAILQQTPIFVDYIVTGQFRKNLLANCPTSKKVLNSVTYQLHNLLKISLSNDNGNISPLSLQCSLIQKDSMWGERRHQDSQEFLTFLLAKIEEEIGISDKSHDEIASDETIEQSALKYWIQYVKNEYSPLKNLFSGLSRVASTCTLCQNISNSFDIFQILQLSIPIKDGVKADFTLENCLDDFIKSEELDEDNMLECSKCLQKNKANKQTLVWRFPDIIVMQIKRFDDIRLDKKITNMVSYPIELDVEKYIDPKSPFKVNTKYSLFGINCHINLGRGTFNTINFGHYTSIVLNRHNDTWYVFDDNNEPNEVDTSDLITANAYLLFYRRIDI